MKVLDAPELMTAREVADVFWVDIRTVAKWRKAGKLASFTTPGGRDPRFFRAQVQAFLNGKPLTPEQVATLRAEVRP